jgi:hypothetical protein
MNKPIKQSIWAPDDVCPDVINIIGKDCEISLEPRPWYCDRGNYVAKIMAHGMLARDLDNCDQWPRYFFDLDRAKLEVEAWLKKRKQFVE